LRAKPVPSGGQMATHYSLKESANVPGGHTDTHFDVFGSLNDLGLPTQLITHLQVLLSEKVPFGQVLTQNLVELSA
jgi:hypothetical protein